MSFQGVVERFFDARFINPVCSGALEIIAARKTAYQFVILEDIPVGEDITDEFEPAVWPLKICWTLAVCRRFKMVAVFFFFREFVLFFRDYTEDTKILIHSFIHSRRPAQICIL